MCFAQGVVWTLILSGWRHWNRSAKFSGQSVGAKIRRWWWGVNNWKIPDAKSKLRDTKLAKNVSEVSAAFLEVWHPGASSPTSQNPILTTRAVLQGRVLKRCTRLDAASTCMERRSGTRLWNITCYSLRAAAHLASLTLTSSYRAWLVTIPYGCAFLPLSCHCLFPSHHHLPPSRAH